MTVLEKILLGLTIWIAASLPVGLIVGAWFKGRGPL